METEQYIILGLVASAIAVNVWQIVKMLLTEPTDLPGADPTENRPFRQDKNFGLYFRNYNGKQYRTNGKTAE